MDRRKVLKNTSILGIVGISGCLDRFDLGNNNDFDSEQQINISIKEIAQNPSLTQHQLDFDVEIEKNTADEDGPPQIRVFVKNLQDNQLILTGKTRSIFGGENDTSEPSQIVLLQPEEWSDNQIENEDCFKLKQEIPRTGTQYETVLHDNGEQDILLDVIGSSNSDQCIPTGEYRFETNYQILMPDEIEGNQEIDEFEWGFILNISRN